MCLSPPSAPPSLSSSHMPPPGRTEEFVELVSDRISKHKQSDQKYPNEGEEDDFDLRLGIRAHELEESPVRRIIFPIRQCQIARQTENTEDTDQYQQNVAGILSRPVPLLVVPIG
jgi:hypothetical protein